MLLVSSWLEGIGLRYAVDAFSKASVQTPEELCRLDVTDFDGLGVHDTQDRRKLFLLVQRIRLAVDEKSRNESIQPRASSRILGVEGRPSSAPVSATVSRRRSSNLRPPASLEELRSKIYSPNDYSPPPEKTIRGAWEEEFSFPLGEDASTQDYLKTEDQAWAFQKLKIKASTPRFPRRTSKSKMSKRPSGEEHSCSKNLNHLEETISSRPSDTPAPCPQQQNATTIPKRHSKRPSTSDASASSSSHSHTAAKCASAARQRRKEITPRFPTRKQSHGGAESIQQQDSIEAPAPTPQKHEDLTKLTSSETAFDPHLVGKDGGDQVSQATTQQQDRTTSPKKTPVSKRIPRSKIPSSRSKEPLQDVTNSTLVSLSSEKGEPVDKQDNAGRSKALNELVSTYKNALRSMEESIGESMALVKSRDKSRTPAAMLAYVESAEKIVNDETCMLKFLHERLSLFRRG